MNSAQTRFVQATPSIVTVEVLTRRCGMLINWTLGARSRNSQLKMKTTKSAGAAALCRTPNLSCINSAMVTTTLERMNSIPAVIRLLMNTSSISTITSARSTRKLNRLIDALVFIRSMRIDDTANDVYTRIGQCLHRRHQLRLLRVIAACDHYRIAGIRGQNLRIGGFRCRRSINDHQAELRGEMIENHLEHRARQQFLRVGRNDACRQHEQPQLRMNPARNFATRAPGQQGRQSDRIVDIEQSMLTRVPHVGVNQQRAFSELRKHGCQIRGEPAAAFAALRAGDREHFAGGAIEPPKNQLAAQRTQRFNRLALRLMSRDDVVSHPTLAAARQYRIIVLLRKRRLDVMLRDTLHLHGCF